MAGTQHNNQISTFKSAFDGGTRPNRFEITGTIGAGMSPTQSTAPEDMETVFVKAGSLPAQTLGIIPIPYRGRIVKFPGDRTYAEWTFTVIDDAGGDGEGGFRRKFEAWHESFNLHEENKVTSPDVLNGTNTGVYTDWTVSQLKMDGEKSGGEMRLVNCWPVTIGEIALSYDTADTLTEYQVTIAYDYLEFEGSEG